MSAETRSASSRHSAVMLLAFVLGAGGLLILLNHLTETRIKQSNDRWLQQQLLEVLNESQRRQSPLITKIESTDSFVDGDAPLPLYRVTANDTTIALILTVVAPDGYNGAIDMLLGVDRNGTISGVRVSHHRETPGLGDDIDLARSDWIRHFDGLTLNSISEAAWSVKRSESHFDAFTGATITPRAVVQSVHRALQWYTAHRETILKL